MHVYIVVPRYEHTWDEVNVYSSFSAVEQFVLQVASLLARDGRDPNWCKILAYEGQDDLHPMFVYTIVASDRLHREPWINPSS